MLFHTVSYVSAQDIKFSRFVVAWNSKPILQARVQELRSEPKRRGQELQTNRELWTVGPQTRYIEDTGCKMIHLESSGHVEMIEADAKKNCCTCWEFVAFGVSQWLLAISGFHPLDCFLHRLQAEVRRAEEERLREEEEAREAEARAEEARRAEEVQTGTWPCCSVSCSLQMSNTLTLFNIMLSPNIHMSQQLQD